MKSAVEKRARNVREPASRFRRLARMRRCMAVKYMTSSTPVGPSRTDIRTSGYQDGAEIKKRAVENARQVVPDVVCMFELGRRHDYGGLAPR